MFAIVLGLFSFSTLLLWQKRKMFHVFSKQCLHFFIASLLFICVFTLMLFVNSTLRHPAKVIHGWEPGVNRMVSVYIKPNESTAIINGSALCTSPLLLVIVVCSRPNNINLRMAIRQTWASVKDSSVKVVFLFGLSDNASVQDEIKKENELHEDIILENFRDTYNNLTIKSVMMLKWFTAYCKETMFLFKIDDDVFLDLKVIPKLLLRGPPPGISTDNFLGGRLICYAVPVTDYRNKWFMPSYLYEGKYYPNYLSGSAYLMSRQVAEKLYNASMSVPMIHMEDIYLTGLCAKEAGIEPIFLKGFTYQHVESFSCETSYFMNHRVKPDEMIDLWMTRSACEEISPEASLEVQPVKSPRSVCS